MGRFVRFFLFSFLVLLISPFGWAEGLTPSTREECEGFRLDEPGEGFSYLPPLSQGYTGFCYGFAGAAIYDYWRLSHGSKDQRRSAPAAAVMDTNLQELRIRQAFSNGGNVSFDDLDGGMIEHVLSAMITQGGCPYDPMASMSDLGTAERALDRIAPLIVEQQTYLQSKQSWGDYARMQASYYSSGMVSAGDQEASCFAGEAIEELKLAGWSENELPDPSVLMQIWNLADPSQELRSILYPDCSKSSLKIVGTPPVIEDSWYHLGGLPLKDGQPSALDSIRRAFDESSPPQPVGIGYCSAVLTFGESYVRPERYGGDSGNWGCGRHASVLLGRKWMNGECHYLLQNSMGESCEDQGYQVPCEAQTGRLWISERRLLNSITSTTFLRDKTMMEWVFE